MRCEQGPGPWCEGGVWPAARRSNGFMECTAKIKKLQQFLYGLKLSYMVYLINVKKFVCDNQARILYLRLIHEEEDPP